MTKKEICAGQILLFYLFDVAETIDLRVIPGLVGGPAVAARLAPKPFTPPYVQYRQASAFVRGRRCRRWRTRWLQRPRARLRLRGDLPGAVAAF